MRISEWSSDVCSSDLIVQLGAKDGKVPAGALIAQLHRLAGDVGRQPPAQPGGEGRGKNAEEGEEKGAGEHRACRHTAAVGAVRAWICEELGLGALGERAGAEERKSVV